MNPIYSPTSTARLRFKALAAVIMCVMSASLAASAQGDAQMTQYWAVPTSFNPAATGNTDYLRIRGGARLQWMGIHNAPKSFLVLADSPLKFGKKQHIGLGVSMMQESLGLFSNLGLNIQASYKLRVCAKGTLSIGVEGGYYDRNSKARKSGPPTATTTTRVPTRPRLPQDLAGNAFDFSLGLEYTHKWFTVRHRRETHPCAQNNALP